MNYEYRIRSAEIGSWPEIFSDGQLEHLEGDLEFVRDRYPHRTFIVERRVVGEWEKWDISSETA